MRLVLYLAGVLLGTTAQAAEPFSLTPFSGLSIELDEDGDSNARLRSQYTGTGAFFLAAEAKVNAAALMGFSAPQSVGAQLDLGWDLWKKKTLQDWNDSGKWTKISVLQARITKQWDLSSNVTDDDVAAWAEAILEDWKSTSRLNSSSQMDELEKRPSCKQIKVTSAERVQGCAATVWSAPVKALEEVTEATETLVIKQRLLAEAKTNGVGVIGATTEAQKAQKALTKASKKLTSSTSWRATAADDAAAFLASRDPSTVRRAAFKSPIPGAMVPARAALYFSAEADYGVVSGKSTAASEDSIDVTTYDLEGSSTFLYYLPGDGSISTFFGARLTVGAQRKGETEEQQLCTPVDESTSLSCSSVTVLTDPSPTPGVTSSAEAMFGAYYVGHKINSYHPGVELGGRVDVSPDPTVTLRAMLMIVPEDKPLGARLGLGMQFSTELQSDSVATFRPVATVGGAFGFK